MKAVISNRIYLDYSDEIMEKVKDLLTFKIPSKIPGGFPKILKLYNRIGDVISIPTGASTIVENFSIKDIRVTPPVTFPEFKFTLYNDQTDIYNKVDDSCLINANPSWGKTFVAISIATKLKVKTLVICHNTLLRDQWIREIEKVLGFTPDMIGTGKVNYSTPIVVSNIQTLRKHVLSLASEFGLIIVDEVHRVPAKIFSDTLNSMKARYKIGLSATLVRKDGMHVVLPYYFSNTVYTAPRSNQLIPEVHIYKIPIEFNNSSIVPWATKVTELYDREDYYQFISNLALTYAKQGHKVLLVGDRVNFLQRMEEDFDNIISLTGKTKDRAKILASLRENNDILAGTTSIFKEGISEEVLSCLILSSLINNEPVLEQLIGRIQRKLDGKISPIIVVDIVPAGGVAKRQGYARAAFYKKQGYKITLIDLTK